MSGLLQSFKPSGQLLIPKRIKVEPVIRRKPRVIFQAIDVTLHPMLDVLCAPVGIQNYFLSQSLELNFVVVTAAINAEKQDDGAMHDSWEQDRTGRECGRRTQEVALRGLAIA